MSKSWTMHDAKGRAIELTPVFETRGEESANPDVEAVAVVVKIKNEEYPLNFMNLYQFIYFVASEELRRGLAMRLQRRVNYIPYEVNFKLSKEEKESGMASRRINLPIDELSMAVARNEAFKLMPAVTSKILTGTKPSELFKGRKKQS